MQISDLRQAKKITIDKSKTVVEGSPKYDLLSFERGPCVHLNAHSSSVQSSRTYITRQTHGTLSA